MSHEAFDVVVVGSGAAGLAAACVAATLGQSVAVVEQSSEIGGTSAISGGMLWMPGHHHLKRHQLEDSAQAVRDYLSNFLEQPFDQRMEAFLRHCAPALAYLEQHTWLRTSPVKGYPDYYPAFKGASVGSRVLEPEAFDAKRLRQHFRQLRPPLPEFMLFGGMMVRVANTTGLRSVRR